MKNFLVDVPVSLNIWIRPECQRKQFEIIKKARPSILFLISDGGRNQEEWDAILENRRLLDEGIDWECEVYRIYENENQGMYTMCCKAHKLIWSKVDRCILLEDDILPAVSFFQYCAELLEKYKDDLRVNVICGMNHLGVSENVNTDYFFSRQGSIWGFAMWRRTYNQYNDFEYANDTYVMNLLKERTKHNKIFWQLIAAYSKNKIYEGHIPWSEYFFEFSMYGQNQLQIIPTKNMICNIGCTKDSAHADEIGLLPEEIRKIFGMKTYEIEFPLRHAKYIIPDVNYEKKRNKILAYNYPWIQMKYRIERLMLRLEHGQWKEVVNNIFNKLRGRVYIEK